MNHNQQLTLPNTWTSYVHIRHSYCHPPRTITTLSCDEVCESIHKGGHSGTQEPESPGECQTPPRTPRETRRRPTMSNDSKKRRRFFGTRGRNTRNVVDPSVPGVETPETSSILRYPGQKHQKRRRSFRKPVVMVHLPGVKPQRTSQNVIVWLWFIHPQGQRKINEKLCIVLPNLRHNSISQQLSPTTPRSKTLVVVVVGSHQSLQIKGTSAQRFSTASSTIESAIDSFSF